MTRNITAPSSFLLSPTQPPPALPSHVKEVSCKNRNFSFSHYPAKLCHRMSSRYGRYLSRHQSGIKISHINFQCNEGVSMGCLYLVQLHQPSLTVSAHRCYNIFNWFSTLNHERSCEFREVKYVCCYSVLQHLYYDVLISFQTYF